jgi:hypothetical protein
MSEEDDVQTPTMADASASAEARLNAEPDALESPAQEVQSPAELATPAEPPPYEVDYQGRKLSFSPQERDELVRHALQSYEKAQQQFQERQQTPPPAPTQAEVAGMPPELQRLLDPYLKPHLDTIQELKQAYEQQKIQARAAEIMSEARSAVEKHAFLGQFKDDPDHMRELMGRCMLQCQQNPQMSLDSAAATIGARYEKHLQTARKAYVEGKVRQAASPVSSGGSAPTTGKSLGMKDLFNGKVMGSALNRLKASLSNG